jgi:hypothetical protein
MVSRAYMRTKAVLLFAGVLAGVAALSYGAWKMTRSSAPPAGVKGSPALVEAERALRALRAEAEAAESVGEELVARAVELAVKYQNLYPPDPVGKPFDRLRDDLARRRADQIARISFADLKNQVEHVLQGRRYGEALGILKKERKGIHDTVEMAALLKRVDQEIRRDFESVDGFGRELEVEQRYALAARHYETSAARFLGTEHYRYLANKPEILSELARADDARPPALPAPDPEVAPKKDPGPMPKETSDQAAPAMDLDGKVFITAFCLKCHGADNPKAKLEPPVNSASLRGAKP